MSIRTLLDASASLWNQLTYEHRENLFAGKRVWDTADYRKRFVGLLGSATAQQVIRRNAEAWRSFFNSQEAGEPAGPPAFWGTQGRDPGVGLEQSP